MGTGTGVPSWSRRPCAEGRCLSDDRSNLQAALTCANCIWLEIWGCFAEGRLQLTSAGEQVLGMGWGEHPDIRKSVCKVPVGTMCASAGSELHHLVLPSRSTDAAKADLTGQKQGLSVPQSPYWGYAQRMRQASPCAEITHIAWQSECLPQWEGRP